MTATRALLAPLLIAAATLAGCTGPSPDPVPTAASTPTTTSAAITTHIAPAASADWPVRPVADGPRSVARQLVRVDVEPTWYCPTASTHSPQLVVYDDGTVMAADTIGAWCDRTPTVRLAGVDPGAIEDGVDSLLRTPGIENPMTAQPWTDVPFTVLTVTGSKGRQQFRAYGLDLSDLDYPAAEVAPRRAVRQFIDRLTALTTAGPIWVPDRIVIAAVTGENPLPRSRTPRWPLPVTAGTRPVLESVPGLFHLSHPRCVPITGTAAATVWTAQDGRQVDSGWLVDGRQRRFAVGIVLPGDPACSPAGR